MNAAEAGPLGMLGVGMIGGSIALRARSLGQTVLGYDRDPGVGARALACGAIDRSVTFEELCRRAETIVVAAHVRGTIDLLCALRARGVRAATILDVASVKAPIVEAASGLLGFVATHPMAGAERSGVEAARADLFESRNWAYVPSGDDAADGRARAFIVSMGATPFPVDGREHDRIVARTSHLPQLVANCFAVALGPASEAVDALCGPTARELLRLSRSSEAMWSDIFEVNAGNVEIEARRLASALERAAATMRATSATCE